MEQLEAFYKEGSNQQKNYQDAKAICSWYDLNCSLQDLSRLEGIVTQMQEIIALDMPFTRMNELANLVFQASSAKEQILDEKLAKTKRIVEADRDAVSRELSDALAAELTDDQKSRIQDKADEVLSQFEGWIESLTRQTANMDSYVTASANNLSGFRAYISSVMSEGDDQTIRSKSVRIIDYVPTINKKIKTITDIDAVLDVIREKLIAELDDNDEIDLK